MSKVQVYGVYIQGDRIVVQSTMAVFSQSGTTARAEDSLPAFDYQSRIPAGAAHLSPDAALEAFIAERRAQRDELWRQIGILNDQCERARAMIGAKS